MCNTLRTPVRTAHPPKYIPTPRYPADTQWGWVPRGVHTYGARYLRQGQGKIAVAALPKNCGKIAVNCEKLWGNCGEIAV